jgi:hypothetical protein
MRVVMFAGPKETVRTVNEVQTYAAVCPSHESGESLPTCKWDSCADKTCDTDREMFHSHRHLEAKQRHGFQNDSLYCNKY